MASIENRSRFVVSVKNRDDLERTFAHNGEKQLKAYLAELKDQGYKPKLARTNDSYAVRIRQVGRVTQCLFASSEQEAIDIKQRVESERRNGLFVDYAKGRSVTFADLMTRYLREEAPRHKGFEIEAYTLNAMLADAGLPRIDMREVLAQHKNPHPSLASKVLRKPTGKGVRLPAPATCFIRKPFADVVPDDFNDYIDDRCQSEVAPATVSREVDLFSAICNLAIDRWRIPVAKSPMDGVRRPQYFNERDRRLKGDEEARLLRAAYEEDAQKSIEAKLEELMDEERSASLEALTKYSRKAIVKEARARYLASAEASYVHVPWFETFIQFQLMTAARRSESLMLDWKDVDFEDQTAFIAETKNGRPRTLPLRQDLIALLKQLPRGGERVFPFGVDALRKAWKRICQAAGLVGEHELHIHDLRHEGISRVADAGGRLPGGISLVDLQAFSGHRDTRMLLRYTHLCMPSLAKRLDEAFADKSQVTIHRGQRRLRKGGKLTMKEVISSPSTQPSDAPQADVRPTPHTGKVIDIFSRRVA